MKSIYENVVTHQPFVYTFVTPDGEQKMQYDEYLRNPYLSQMVNDSKTYRLIVGRTIYLFPMTYLAQKPELQSAVDDIEIEWRANRFKYFAPVTQSSLDCLNDTEHDLIVNMGPNGTGKTTAAVIRWLLGREGRAAFPMDKSWPIFSEYGVKWREHTMPLSLAVGSYEEKNLRDTVWPIMINWWVPLSELSKDRNKKVEPSWGRSPRTQLNCGTTITYFTYEQTQSVLESARHHSILWDEQSKENLFDAADSRTRRVSGEHVFAFTPHKVKGRKDTGGRSWLIKMANGTRTKGHTVGRYTTKLLEMPDWIFSNVEKEKEFEKWEREPMRQVPPDLKVIAEGRARLYGEPHFTEDIVFDEWNHELSVIEPLWQTPPADKYTLYRGLDHGLNNPTCCLNVAVDKDMNVIFFREYFKGGRVVHDDVAEIVRMCGNRLVPDKVWDRDDNVGVTIKRFREEQVNEHYFKDVMDCRSFNLPSGIVNKTLGFMYKCAGLNRLTPADGSHSPHWIPMVQWLFHRDPNHKHIITGRMGAPRGYVFSNCTNLIREIENCHFESVDEDEKNKSEKIAKVDDHAISAMGFLVMAGLKFMGNMWGVADTGREGMRGSTITLPADMTNASRSNLAGKRQHGGGYRRV